MRIDFEGKSIMMEDISYTWFIESEINSYRLSLEFIGGIDENGNQDLESSALAYISLNEITHNIPEIIDQINTKADIESTIESDTIMNCAPEDRLSIISENTSSYSDTMADFNKLLTTTINTLMQMELKQTIEKED